MKKNKEQISQSIRGNHNTQNINIVNESNVILKPWDLIAIANDKITVADYDSAIKYFELALQESKKSDDIKGIIRSNLGNAECHMFLKNKILAFRYSEESIKIASEANDLKHLSQAYMILSQIQEVDGKLEDAIESINNALSTAKEYGDEFIIAKISIVKARFHLRRNQLDEVSNILKEHSETLFKNGGKEEVLALELFGIGHINKNEFESGKNYILKAIEKAKEYKLYNTAFDFSINLGRIFFSQKQFNEAKTIFEDALSISSLVDSDSDCMAKLCITETLYAQNEMNDALEMSKELLSQAKSRENSFIIGESYLIQSIILIDKECYDKVYENINLSFEYFQQIDNFTSSIRNLILFGDLCIKSKNPYYSNEFIRKYNYFIKSPKLNLNSQKELHKQAFVISDNIGDFDGAISSLEKAKKLHGESEKEVLESIENWIELIKSKDNLSKTFGRIISCENPDELAGTVGATNLQEANKWVLGPMLDWMEFGAKTPMAINCSSIGLVYDLWGQLNFSRLILNNRNFTDAFHLSIEISNVAEAKLACRNFLPITDCLTLIWKGNFDIGTGAIPRFLNDGVPDKNWKPNYNIEGLVPLTMAPMACYTLPFDILKFYIGEARPFVESGKLILVPGPMVGCTNTEHGILEELYCKAINGYSIQSLSKSEKKSRSIPLVYPSFPSLELDTLSQIIKDEEDGLKALRQILLNWSLDIEQNGVSDLKLRLFKEEFREILEPVNKQFKKISTKLSAPLHNTDIKSEFQEIHKNENRINTSLAFSSSALWNSLNKHIENQAGFACFRLQNMGRKWDLNCSNFMSDNREANQLLRPEMFNWLKMPGEMKTYMLVKNDKGEQKIIENPFNNTKDE